MYYIYISLFSEFKISSLTATQEFAWYLEVYRLVDHAWRPTYVFNADAYIGVDFWPLWGESSHALY